MHTKKTNNTNKLMQISYHFALTKIQKLQNLKNNNNEKKNFFSVPAGIAQNWPIRPVFFPVQNKGVNRTGLLAGTVYTDRTGRYGTVLTPLVLRACLMQYSAPTPVAKGTRPTPFAKGLQVHTPCSYSNYKRNLDNLTTLAPHHYRL